MKAEIKYKTAGGSTVTFKRDDDDHRSDPWGSFECGGCGGSERTYLSLADKHARKCRAL